YIVRGASLANLQLRPKNMKALIDEASHKMEMAVDSPADACSGMWYDEGGNLLVATFAHRIETTSCWAHEEWPYYEGAESEKWTMADVDAADPSRVHYDGVPVSQKFSTSAHEALQFLHSQVHPIVHQWDIRHDPMADVPNTRRPGVQYHENEMGRERDSVTHLVHAWAMQGQKNGPLVISKDWVQGSSAAMAVNWYFQVTREIADLLSAYFKKAFPEYHKKYSEAFAAGCWSQVDPGPWLGQALVFNLQVLPHVDGLDNGPTACFPVGFFSGGDLILSLFYRYAPGDILIFLSGWLYHAVQLWQP
ncbi:hypothetical protein L208DRAFT_1053825, partial [Tricholoma matsutake]